MRGARARSVARANALGEPSDRAPQQQTLVLNATCSSTMTIFRNINSLYALTCGCIAGSQRLQRPSLRLERICALRMRYNLIAVMLATGDLCEAVDVCDRLSYDL